MILSLAPNYKCLCNVTDAPSKSIGMMLTLPQTMSATMSCAGTKKASRRKRSSDWHQTVGTSMI